MSDFSQRVQSVLTENQYEHLQRAAKERGRSTSAMIREAVQKLYVDAAERERRERALDRIVELKVPVADWEQMESEIEQGVQEAAVSADDADGRENG